MDCLFCKSTNVKKNGRSRVGSQRFFCNDCGKSFVIDGARTTYTENIKELVKNDLKIGMGIREISRKYGISTNTIYSRK